MLCVLSNIYNLFYFFLVFQLSARIARLELDQKMVLANNQQKDAGDGAVPGTSKQSSGEPDLFQDMMDNFRELAENQLQCVICSELIVEAVR